MAESGTINDLISKSGITNEKVKEMIIMDFNI